MKDAAGQQLAIGDTVLLARTSKSAGVSWSHRKITRMTSASFWSEEPCSYAYGDRKVGDVVETGPFKISNCVKVPHLEDIR